jgi:hypothetical protein
MPQSRLRVSSPGVWSCGRGSVQLLPIGETHVQLEEEAIELRLGQRIGALHLERVLRREHEERLLERVALPPT